MSLIMGKLFVSQRVGVSQTLVSNEFIEYYMPFCNELQLKVYLHVLKSAQAGESTEISEIADFCNETEREVMRALQYWERLHVLSVEYSDTLEPVGVQVNELRSRDDVRDMLTQENVISRISAPAEPARQKLPVIKTAQDKPSAPQEEYQKREYTPEEMESVLKDPEFSQLVFVAEQYEGRPLIHREAKTLLFLYDSCGLPSELIEFLMEYCIERGKKDFRYFEKVGIDWAKNNIKTRDEALIYSGKYDKIYYSIMKGLGKNEAPTKIEADFIRKWHDLWGFSEDLILEACNRTVLATDSNRFKYADKILESWRSQSVTRVSDLAELDRKWQEKKSTSLPAPRDNNWFNRYTQKDYDFNALEQLISNH